jgi:hypothetical protein
MAQVETRAHAQRSHFSYISEERSTRTEGHLWKEKVVETGDGSLRRLLAIDNRPLSPAQAAAEDRRIAEMVADPAAFRALNLKHEDDETHATELLQMLPRAFRISRSGVEGGCSRFSFHPDPSFQPSTYEERIIHVLDGTVSIKEPENRLCNLEAVISQPVEFGFGLLGRVNSGGHFSIRRTQVEPGIWKTSHIQVHIQGRILLLQSLAKDQEVDRTQITLVPQQLTLREAAVLSQP